MRLSQSTRKTKILAAALSLAEIYGYQQVQRDLLAVAAGCATGTINHHFSTMDDLRTEIVRHAVAVGNLLVIGQALAAQHPDVQHVPDDTKRAAMSKLVGV